MTEDEFAADENLTEALKSFLQTPAGAGLMRVLDKADPLAGCHVSAGALTQSLAQKEAAPLINGAAVQHRRIRDLIFRLTEHKPRREPVSSKAGRRMPTNEDPPITTGP